MGTVVFAAWQIEISNGKILPAYANISITIITVLLVVELIYKGNFGINVFSQLHLMQSGC